MSAKYTGLVFELDIPHNKAWVLHAMADHADHDGKNVHPRLGFIAWKTGYSLSSVKRIVADLRDDGILLPCGYTPGGVVIYRIELSHIKRKAPYVEPQNGHPKGVGNFGPQKPRLKIRPSYLTPSQNETGLDELHNHQKANSKESEITISSKETTLSQDFSDFGASAVDDDVFEDDDVFGPPDSGVPDFVPEFGLPEAETLGAESLGAESQESESAVELDDEVRDWLADWENGGG